MDRDNEDLRQQLQEPRRDRESDDTFARATPTASLERIEAVRMGADILEAPGLRNVHRGLTLTNANERHLVLVREYLQQLPKSLRTPMAEAFGLDMASAAKRRDTMMEIPLEVRGKTRGWKTSVRMKRVGHTSGRPCA